jgi:hypothetical protein
MELSFIPIARRDLKFVSGNQAMDIVLAISAPYRPPKGPEELRTGAGDAACMIQDCDDPTLALEICAIDEFEALELGMVHLERYIDSLLSDPAGELRYSDGTPVDRSAVSLIGYYVKRSQEKRAGAK